MTVFDARPRMKRLLSCLLCLACLGFFQPVSAETLNIDEAWKTLSKKSYSDKAVAIEAIVEKNPPEALSALKAMLEGQLFYAKSSKALFILREDGDNYLFTPLFGGDTVTQENKRGYKKVRINNRLRVQIRQSLASMQLRNADAAVRLEAVLELLKEPDEEIAALIAPLVVTEKDGRVLSAMQMLMAIIQLEQGDETAQASAIETLSSSLNPSALNALTEYKAPNEELEISARAAINKIQAQRDLYSVAETVFFGLSLGSVLALSAIGP